MSTSTDNFWSILRESILVQAIITLICLITICIMYLQGLPVPDELKLIVSIIIGYYFGQRSAAKADSILTKAGNISDAQIAQAKVGSFQ